MSEKDVWVQMESSHERVTVGSCHIRPLEDRVVVRHDEAVTKTPGGILIPDMAREKPLTGTVVAVGPGKFCPELAAMRRATPVDPVLKHLAADSLGRSPMPVKPGDRVCYTRYAGTEVPGDDRLAIMRVDDIIAVLEPTDKREA